MRAVPTLYFLLLAALSGFTCTAKAALPDARGLQISLVTGLSRFEIPLDPASGNSATPLPKSSFAVSIALTNRGDAPVSISLPANTAADAFIVTLLNPNGEVEWIQVEWTSDEPARAVVLAPRATLRPCPAARR